MGPRNNPSFQSHNYLHRLAKALEFAVSEWLLMFLLFIDACFAFLIAKFASYCQLQGPCLMCSRFDHVLAKDKKGIYLDSICNHHKSEISSVVLCRVHDKLIDVHGICENCLLSFVTKTKNTFNAETFRLLVGKMGSNPLPEDCNLDSSRSRICFCCNEECVAKNLLPTSSIHSDASKNETNVFVDEFLEPFRSTQMEKNRSDRSLEFDYEKVNVNSDGKSELPVSDKESGRAFIHKIHLDSQSEVLDLHNDPATVAASDSRITEQISFDEVRSSNLAESPADKFLETTDHPRTGEMIKDPVTESDPSTTTNGHQVSNHLDLGDAYKLAISSKGRQLLDQKSFQDSSSRVTEDLKLLLSHRSNDNLISPKPSFNSDELMGIQFLQKRLSLERNESNLSLDGSIVSEIDGETVVDRLKRQVEHDKKVMGILYKELEEERNASAVATNQAMAMITRLQEEKAALYTEALQCLRMMEEQAEFGRDC
ncbi:hypothetical protein L6452_36250 [Arctium lappa]|uniref:Uncharacterized protein n=1 Tax=Arctium lappa TaxID=4217 RepID=A0ACB8Y8V1_ARCLA|nr:hypothetical protein L6452_36250 [Arctium lappa]